MMSPLRFVVTTMSNWAGALANWWATLSMMRCSGSISGYSGAISSKTRLKRPSVSFMMLAFVAHGRRLHVLDARVEVLDVLAHDDHVHALAGIARRHAGQLACGPHVGVRLEELAQGDVGALLAGAARGFERALEHDPGALDRVARLARHAGAVAAPEDLRAGLGLLPVDGPAG